MESDHQIWQRLFYSALANLVRGCVAYRTDPASAIDKACQLADAGLKAEHLRELEKVKRGDS